MGNQTGSKTKYKLPERYPRESEIMVIGEMYELDHVFELLSNLGKCLNDMSDTITSLKEWNQICTDPLASLIKLLSRAYVEYERFWRHAGWKLEDDPTLLRNLSDFGDMRWRVKEIEDAPYYDPAQLSCAQSLYFSLALMQCPGGKDWVNYCISSLQQELTRYYAASLEVLLQRNKVFTGGRQKGALAKSTRHIQRLVKDYRNLKAKELFALADKSIIGDMSQGTFNNHVKNARKAYPKEKKAAD